MLTMHTGNSQVYKIESSRVIGYSSTTMDTSIPQTLEET